MQNSTSILRTPFVSSSSKTQQLGDFFNAFKTDFAKELRRLGAKDIKFSLGHFFISGFFIVGEQAYYFCTFDLREGQKRLYLRTAENYQDYTGGQNHYFNIDKRIAYEIARTFRVEIATPKPRQKKERTVETVLAGNTTFVCSFREAQHIFSKIAKHFGAESTMCLSRSRPFRGGRASLVEAWADTPCFNFYYSADSKRVSFTLKETSLLERKELAQ